MPTLTPLQIAAAAHSAGFRGEQVVQAVAVAYAESSWNTDAANTCCNGLWQINLSAHQKKIQATVPNWNWKDPVDNAKAAYMVYRNAGGWCTRGSPPNCNPWAGYGTTRYNQALNQAKMARDQLNQRFAGRQEREVLEEILRGVTSRGDLGAGSGVLGDAASAAVDTGSAIIGVGTAIVEFLNRIGVWISDPENWARVAKVIGGMTLVIVGAGVVAKDPIVKTAVRATPVGRMAKGIKR